MPCSCCDFASAAADQFDEKKAARQLEAYRRGHVESTTRLLRDGLVASGLASGVLLDIGAGIGALTFELLDRGIERATAVEASKSYVTAAQDEARRRQRSHLIAVVHGDFVNLANSLPPADVVTLDRVVCCYPDYNSLLEHAVARGERTVALSYPRDRWFVRMGVRVENSLRRLRGNPFRTFVHPEREMQRLIADSGFHLVKRSKTMAWAADIYAR
jgi:SAM-dependent methyltransferase